MRYAEPVKDLSLLLSTRGVLGGLALFFGTGLFANFVNDHEENCWDVFRAWWNRLTRPSAFSTLSLLFGAVSWSQPSQVFAVALGLCSYVHDITSKSTEDTLKALSATRSKKRDYATFEGTDLPRTR